MSIFLSRRQGGVSGGSTGTSSGLRRQRQAAEAGADTPLLPLADGGAASLTDRLLCRRFLQESSGSSSSSLLRAAPAAGGSGEERLRECMSGLEAFLGLEDAAGAEDDAETWDDVDLIFD